MKPAAAHRRSVSVRRSQVWRSITKSSSATSARDASARSASGCSAGTASTSGWAKSGSQCTSGLRGSPAGELQVDPAAGHERGAEGVVGLLEPEPHPGVLAPEAADHPGHEPGAERELERERHRPGLRVDHLVDRRDPVVEGVDHRVDVTFEHVAGLGRAQHTAVLVEQRGAHLTLQPGQRPGHPGLADPVDLGHLGHGHPVHHLLEPAQLIGLHVHDANAWVTRPYSHWTYASMRPTIDP